MVPLEKIKYRKWKKNKEETSKSTQKNFNVKIEKNKTKSNTFNVMH